MSPRVLLVIACWGGPRRTPDPAYDADHAHYLKFQIDSLERFDSRWTDIMFVSTGGLPDYLTFLDSLKKDYKVIERPNVGMSYGSFDAAWKADGTYDYYIFLEDDFVFVRNNFDVEMVNYFESLENCGYLCQLAWGLRVAHPAIMNGMASNDCLARMVDLPGASALASNNLDYYGAVQTEGQKAWGDRIIEVGLGLYDMGRKFRAPFVEADGSLICWHPSAPEYIIAPAQIYHRILENPSYIDEYSITDEDWDRFRTFYLFMRNVYLSDEDRARFIANVSPCRMKTREDLARATAIYDGLTRNRSVV